MPRSESTSEFQPLEDKEVEYFFASDASAIIEHTNRVIFLEVRIDVYILQFYPVLPNISQGSDILSVNRMMM